MANYYCLMAGLPDIAFDSPMSVSFPDIREEMELTLSDKDKKRLQEPRQALEKSRCGDKSQLQLHDGAVQGYDYIGS